ncbi:MAG: V-type ATP synthase subunit I [Candidatus Woesearchaeota archaeon]
MLTKKLYKLNLFGNNKDKQKIIEKLQELGVLHIADSDLDIKDLQKDKSLIGTDEISLLLLKLNFLLNELGIEKKFEIKKLPKLEHITNDTKKLLTKHYDEIKKLSDQKQIINQEIKEIISQLNTLNKIPFKIKNTQSKKFTTTIYKSQKPLKLELPKNSILKTIKKKETYYKITYLRENKKELEKNLRKIPIKKISLPEFENSTTLKKELIAKLKNKNEELKKIKLNIQTNLSNQKNKLLFYTLCLENYYAQKIISNKFQTSKNHFLIKGYTEQKNIDKIRQIENINLYLELADSEGPTKLSNKNISKQFEEITKLFSIPKYGAADPTLLITFFYPLFFGLMLSDVGYGLILLLSTFLIHIKFKEKAKTITTIFTLSAISTILFGLLFGSFFGELITITPLIANSFQISFELLIISLIIGLVHINIGIILKIIQNINMKKKLIDYLAIAPFILIQILILLLYFRLFILSSIIALILVVILFYTKGIFGIMDITNFFGTWFSYARILALNLATAGVALAINIIASKALELGVLGIILWTIIIILGHTFNFVISMIGVTINAARLHYVEFFSQFFESGGVEFSPFKIKQKLEQ